MLMERTIKLVASLPNHSRTQETLTNSFIGKLWDSLDHPPLLYMGDEYKWRRPDGSFNVRPPLHFDDTKTQQLMHSQNPMMPQLGAAGTKYSRTCKPHVTPLGALPDPETVYEAVMARDGFKKNPNNVSSILWYWATIIIHGKLNLIHNGGRQSDSYIRRPFLDESARWRYERCFFISGPGSSIRRNAGGAELCANVQRWSDEAGYLRR